MRLLLLLLSISVAAASCKHDSLVPDKDTDPIDTLDCQPNQVYFQNDILPLLQSSCAMPGCHDAASAQDGVVLTDYASIMSTADVRPGDPGSSDLYEMITEDDPEKRMPPMYSNQLTAQQIQAIYQWIAGGAGNTYCEEANSCDTASVSFSAKVLPIFQQTCNGCHSGSVPSGGISLNSHAGVMATVNSGRLVGAVQHNIGFSPMPQGMAKLDDCKLALIRNWVAQGAADN